MRCLAVFVACIITAGTATMAQPQERIPITEGTVFLVGTIHPETVAPEAILPEGYELLISSRLGARVTIGGVVVVTVRPGETIRQKIGVGEVLNITADRPISVATYQHVSGNGEMAWHVPVAMWGTSYHPFAWWQDGFGLQGQPYSDHTAKIRVIAARNRTTVRASYLGIEQEYVLQSGQAWVIDPPVIPNGTRKAITDPTGMQITADGPIGVISGHAKGAVLRYPDAMPDTGAYARRGNFMRSNFHDAMLPDVMAGQLFVTAPLIYSPTRLRGTNQTAIGVEDDRGDVIRFVGITDGTSIRRNGSTVATIDAGQTWMASSCEEAVVWSTSQPALCAQYGKSYARITSQASKPEDDPSTDAGLPLLQVVPPMDRAVSSASFVALPGFTNAITVVGTVNALNTLTLDGELLSTTSPVRRIGTSEWGYVSTYVTDGSHQVQASDATQRFLLWTYGSIDGLQPARIYGSIASMNMAWDCADSVVASVETLADTVKITFGVTAPDRSSCAGIALAYAERSDGGIVKLRGDTMTITRATPTSIVDGVAVFAARSGRSLRIPFHLDGTTSIQQDRSSSRASVRDGIMHIASDVPITTPIIMHDVTGAIVLSRPVPDGRDVSIDVGAVARGVYLVSFNGHTQRLIVD